MSQLVAEADRPKSYYPALTGIRAIAAYMVFFHHFNPFEIRNPTSPKLPQTAAVDYLLHFVEQWHIGVTIFFVLSGFLIASRYMDRIQPSWHWLRFYLQNRFARIYPVYFLVSAIYFAFWFGNILGYKPISTTGPLISLPEKVLAVLLNITLVRAYFLSFLFVGAPAAWSLTIEESFYLLAPFLLLGVKNRPVRLLFYPAMLLGIGATAVVAVSFSPVWLFGFMKSMQFMLNWTFFGRSTEFIIGIGLAYLVKHTAAQQARASWRTYVGILWVLGCLVAITSAEYVHPRIVGTNTYEAIFLNNVVLPIGIACLFWGLTKEQTLIRAFLESKLLSVLGKSSYAFYMIHGGVLYLTLLHFGLTNLGAHFLLTIVLSLTIFYVIEEPLHKRLRAKNLPKAVTA
jgi:peptidoglycan/LPS O-acetylase OafA/YrhL